MRRFGFGSSSTSIESLLAKPTVKLQDLLENDDQLLQELHLQHQKLISFLRQPSVLSQLVNYIVSEKTHTTSTKSCAYVACEILSAGVPALLDGLVYAHPELLTMLWALLDQSHKLSPRQMVGFCRVNAALMEKRPGDLIRFIQAHDDIVLKWIHHIFSYNGNGCPYLSDLLVALTQSQQPSGEGTSIVQWLADHGLLTLLVDRLQPQVPGLQREIAQRLLCDIIYTARSNNALITELTSPMTASRLCNYMLPVEHNDGPSPVECGIRIIRALRVSDKRISTQYILAKFAEQLPSFVQQLSLSGSKESKVGLHRLAVCELLLELERCSYDEGQSGSLYRQSMMQCNAIARCLDLFFAFPENNILHTIVYCILQEGILWNERPFTIHLLQNGNLMDRILQAWEENDQAISQGQSRRGYMGHLALLTKDIRQAFRRDDGLLKYLSMPSGWDSHMTKVDQRVENQITLNGDPVFWAAGYYHENDQEIMNDTGTIYDNNSSSKNVDT
ncbi:hypothetical protein VTP01DRAFT_8693 [Rhizomucor pusillus]|uniref:uncharacterized protein n=1 Tax=Rhizomucor pusillus TaxID=4840 RepID=UPI0037435C9D